MQVRSVLSDYIVRLEKLHLRSCNCRQDSLRIEEADNISQGYSSMNRKTKSPRRFPRILNENEAIGLEKLAWNTPQFLARVKTEKRAVDFTFRISVPQFPKHYRALQMLLFASTTESWEKAFREAYLKSKYGDKDLAKFMVNPLHELFRAGVKEWLDETWDLEDTEKGPAKPPRLEAFSKGSQMRKHQPDPRVALRLARRRNRLLPAARRLRIRLESTVSSMKPEKLRREISRVLPYGGFLAALRNILKDLIAGPGQFFNRSGLSAKLVIEDVLKSELEKKGYDIKTISVKTYLKVGEQLINCLSSLPKPLL